ncbi:MAG: FAD-dependent oxidoreductase [Anaerolineaceae bacterium]|nr:FAD-dependent oxidoreductase [Anaerolineaceae bacterium]
MQQYTILGSGAAGIAAARAIRERDAQAGINIISDDAYGYYSRPGLAYLITGEISESGLYPFKEKEFQELGFTRIADQVTRIDPDEHMLFFPRRAPLRFDRLLVATGSVASQPNLPGMELDGVVKLDTMEDAHRILKLGGRGRAAVVIGGGITALEIVEGLIARGAQTYYFLRGDRYWSNILDETESAIVERRLADEGVKIYKKTEVAEITGQHGRVRSICTTSGRQIQVDIVAFAIGIQPRIELAQEAGIKVDRGILVDESMRTNCPDVYAAGDVAQVRDPRSGKYILDSLWEPARQQGEVAGANMAGAERVYIKPFAFNVTRLSRLTTTIIGSVGSGKDVDLVGITHGDSEAWGDPTNAIVAQDRFKVNRLRLLVGKDVLSGALLMGDQTLSRALEELVRRQVDITPIRERLLQGGNELPRLILEYWQEWERKHVEPVT